MKELTQRDDPKKLEVLKMNLQIQEEMLRAQLPPAVIPFRNRPRNYGIRPRPFFPSRRVVPTDQLLELRKQWIKGKLFVAKGSKLASALKGSYVKEYYKILN